MGREEQLIYVEKFYQLMIKGHPPRNIADYIMLGWGRADLVGAPERTVVASALDIQTKNVYLAHKRLDTKGQGFITVLDLRKSFWDIYVRANDQRTTETEQGMVRMRPFPTYTPMWVDVFGDDKAAFEKWVYANHGGVKIIKTVGFNTEMLTDDSFAEAMAFTIFPDWMRDVKRVKRVWVLFETTNANVWPEDASVMGIATVAPKGRDTTPDDTVDRPPPLDPMQLIRDALAEAAKAVGEVAAEVAKPVAKGFGFVIGAALAGWGLTKLLERKRGD
jgi:hypothetical protein